jgi:hypothetical protein
MPGGRLEAQRVRLLGDGPHQQPGAVAVGGREDQEEAGEHTDPQHQPARDAGGHRPVDDHPDQDRHPGLAQLVQADQGGAGP